MKSVRSLRIFCWPTLNNINVCCQRQSTKVVMSHNVCKFYNPRKSSVRALGLGPTSKDFTETSAKPGPLTKLHAAELVLHLTDGERKILFSALQEFESKKMKEEYEDTLAGHRWRSKLGRPSKVPTLGDVDPTGTYCPVPEDWLKKKYAETVPKPNTSELFHICIYNAVPFVGFGFLDNAIMIIAGDSIEITMGAYITLSTMAAAALGNTLSDVIGIGSSYYVERAAAGLGLRSPNLAPMQLEMNVTRRFANMGRVLGITFGCLLGMTPLLFMKEENKEKKEPTK